MSGPSQSSQATQQNLTNTQVGIEQQQANLAATNQAEGMSLMQPLISQLSSLSSGNQGSIMTALAPYLTNITQSASAQKGQIAESTAPGVGRDVALANVNENTQNQIASTKNSLVTSAPQQLATLGQGIESFGLSDVGSAVSAGNAASSSNQVTMQVGEQQKAATMGFLGSLAGAGGSLLSGGFGAGGAFGCWIAEAVYGLDDARTHLLRAWLNGPFSDTALGTAVMWFYMKFGRAGAAAVTRNPRLKRAMKYMFDLALQRAMREMGTRAVMYAG